MRARILESEYRKWWTLGAVAFALFMIMLDNTVVNVALPSIQQSLGASLSGLEWVVNAYALTFAVLMLSGGKLADLLGGAASSLSAWPCSPPPPWHAAFRSRSASSSRSALRRESARRS